MNILIKKEETNPNSMKVHWKTIVKAFEFHDKIIPFP